MSSSSEEWLARIMALDREKTQNHVGKGTGASRIGHAGGNRVVGKTSGGAGG